MTVKIKNDGTILIEKIVVGTPIKTVNAAVANGINPLGAIEGDVLVYNATTGLWEAQSTFDMAIVDGGEY